MALKLMQSQIVNKVGAAFKEQITKNSPARKAKGGNLAVPKKQDMETTSNANPKKKRQLKRYESSSNNILSLGVKKEEDTFSEQHDLMHINEDVGEKTNRQT